MIAGKSEDMRELAHLDCRLAASEYMATGHTGCAGCGAVLAIRQIFKTIGPDYCVVSPSGCMTPPIIKGAYANMMAPLGAHGSFAAGLKYGLEVIGDTTPVIVFAGDGGTFDIGLQALSGAAERNDDFTYVCYDNEAYMNTGIQRSSSTPLGAWTVNVPSKPTPKKDIMRLIAAHEVTYAASISIAYPADLIRKVTKSRSIKGFRFFHVLAGCPTGWRFESELTIHMCRLAVQSKIHPLYEIEAGEIVSLQKPPIEVPVDGYIRGQGRFGHLDEESVARIQSNVDRNWQRLLATVKKIEYLPY